MKSWVFGRRYPLALLTLILTLAAFGGGHSGTSVIVKAAGEKLVLAFYYPWYGPGAFDGGQMPDRPVEAYISDHQDVIERQVKEAQGAGIDAFISSWQGTGTATDANFPRLLDAAAKHGFHATVYFETQSAMQHGDVVGQLRSVLNYASHPAFLRWNGKPVVFFWSPQSVPGGPGAWRAIRQQIDPNNTQMWSVDTTDRAYLDVFDTIHFFSAGKWNGNTDVAKVNAQWRGIVDGYNKAHGTQRLWTAGVIPGWDESKVQPPRPGAKVFPRRDGALYAEAWQGAMASNPEWITITSYNEWFEGTQIEPSVSYGTKYLDMTRQFANSWKRGPSPCDGGTSFPQTGHAICRQMEGYWKQYGGIAQFGFPISDPLNEINAADGRSYTVQYFERARFELHPENKPPYDVLLGLLGKQFHKPDAPAGAINDGQHQYFKETGHNVSKLFYDYWQAHGGLFVNGFPISEEIQERAADGKTYSVQYFERARYEAHPENSPPYNVLLGLLGKQAWAARGGK
jgi:hypothetical protein